MIEKNKNGETLSLNLKRSKTLFNIILIKIFTEFQESCEYSMIMLSKKLAIRLKTCKIYTKRTKLCTHTCTRAFPFSLSAYVYEKYVFDKLI